MISTPHYKLKSIHLEVSTLCQAMCSRCPRILDHNKLSSSGNVSFQDFETHILPYFYPGDLGHLTLCGNYGDPMMNPDTPAIALSVLEKINKPLAVTINTNGGVGHKDKYFQLGEAGARMVISLEGMTQESHERYRQNVNFSNLKENILATQAGRDAGGFDAQSSILHFYVIPWAHTVAELPEIVQFAKECGAVIEIPYPRHLEGGHPSFNTKGKLIDVITLNENTLNFPFGKFSEKAIPGWTRSFSEILEYDWGPELQVLNTMDLMKRYGTKYLNHTNRFEYEPGTYTEIYNFYENPVKVNCKAKTQQNIYISSQLNVHPCCHLGTQLDSYINRTGNFNLDDDFGPLIEHYVRLGGPELFNLYKRNLFDIINGPKWNRLALNHIEGKNIVKYCEIICGLCS